ncbi:hypothetical protein DFH09DRAFT_1311406 [Mycena vulgaris]|nr:hypothetical protein DFH09DRAFT_1311406 [Mycena vulgaris]
MLCHPKPASSTSAPISSTPASFKLASSASALVRLVASASPRQCLPHPRPPHLSPRPPRPRPHPHSLRPPACGQLQLVPLTRHTSSLAPVLASSAITSASAPASMLIRSCLVHTHARTCAVRNRTRLVPARAPTPRVRIRWRPTHTPARAPDLKIQLRVGGT